MDRQEQIEFLREHYEHPYKRGAKPDADVEVEGGNPGCGDIIRVYLTVDEDGKHVKDVRWTGEGCTISQASASLLMELLDEKEAGHPSLEEVTDLDYNVLQDVMGKETMQLRPRCATLALGTLKSAIRKFEREKLMRENGIDPKTYGR
ncbi:MAG: iron-sulfur cluster assembly scaffold protein [Dehalococcoidia bacterium]